MTTITTKEKIINVSIKSMLERGYQVTSIGDITKEVGITKAGFFHHFASKEKLASEILEHFYQPMKLLLETELAEDLSRDPFDQVMNYVDLVAKGITDPKIPTSCLFGNLMQELSLNNPQLRQQGHDLLNDWSNAIGIALNRACVKYKPNSEVNTQSLAEMFIAIYEGALILAKTKQDDDIILETFAHYKRYLESIIK